MFFARVLSQRSLRARQIKRKALMLERLDARRLMAIDLRVVKDIDTSLQPCPSSKQPRLDR